jgi:ubiquinone/menaquinone biosynthesis C-methylase UbiE
MATVTSGITDFEPVKVRQKAMWASGDYSQIGVRLQIVGESLCEAADVGAPDRVLDVAAGNGNATLAAARRFADVTATDYVPELLDRARVRAEADHLPVTFQVADAERLPFPDASFDVALSTFGVMFAPNQLQAASELVRVVKPGGRIALANWTPEGFVGQFLRAVTSLVPPPAGLASPLLWGTEARLQELFAANVSKIRAERRQYAFRYRSIVHWIDVFRTCYGPTHKAFEGLDAAGQQQLHDRLAEVLRRGNRSTRGGFVADAEYLEVVITR